MCAKLGTVTAINNRDHARKLSYYCLLAPRMYIFVLRAHPVRSESHNQRNTTGEVATLLTSKELGRQHALNRFAAACDQAGMNIRTKRLRFYVSRNPRQSMMQASGNTLLWIQVPWGGIHK